MVPVATSEPSLESLRGIITIARYLIFFYIQLTAAKDINIVACTSNYIYIWPMFEKCIYFNLITLTRKVSKIWQQEFERLGLTPSHGYRLFAIKELPGSTQKELGLLLELDASNITRLIDGLENKGLVKKTSRGKGAKFSITAEGNEAYIAVKNTMDSLYASMQKKFGEKPFASFVSDLEKAKETILKKG